MSLDLKRDEVTVGNGKHASTIEEEAVAGVDARR